MGSRLEVPRRLQPTPEVRRQLYLRSGNQCAFPGCLTVLLTRDGTMIGRICHIEAALPDGKRFNPAMSNEERRSYENLLLLCGDHHTIIDDDDERYTVEWLRQIKRQHEAKRSEQPNSLRMVPDVDDGVWERLAFDQERDLQPALMGRSLGPADAAACPRLAETELIIQELEKGYSARLSGVPGAGKSVCAMQVAFDYHKKGWHVFRAKQANVRELKLDRPEAPALYIVDDAHLTPRHVLNAAELSAHSNAFFLATFNTAYANQDAPGTTYLDGPRAVQTIAEALRAERQATLRLVSRVDTSVGDKPFEESLEARLNAAQRAEVPWQFCFILGGGWTRASAAASSARAVGADLVLAAIAARQILTRDEPATRADIGALLAVLEPTPPNSDIDRAIEWLARGRLIKSKEQLQTPHQRFAAVILIQLLLGAGEAKASGLAKLLNGVIAAEDWNLIGLRNLLQELRLWVGNRHFSEIVERDLLRAVTARCWKQQVEEQRNLACLLLSELQCYFDPWIDAIIDDDGLKLATWINEAAGESAYGAGYLLGQLSMKDAPFADRIAARVNLQALAAKLSAVPAAQVTAICELVTNVSRSYPGTWRRKFIALLNRPRLLRLASEWPQTAYLSSFAGLCTHIAFHDEGFALELLAAFKSRVADRLAADPLESFHELADVFWHVLRLHDPLGIYKGRKGPTAAMRKAGRAFAGVWTDDKLAEAFSQATLRDFQTAGGLLEYLRKVDRKRYGRIVQLLDWRSLETTLAPHLNDLFHDADIFLSICGLDASAQRQISAMLRKHDSSLTKLTPRLAYTAFDFAVAFVRSGREIGISNPQHVSWNWGVILLAKFAEHDEDLIQAFLAPHLRNAASSLSRQHSSWYKEPLLFLRLVRQLDPFGFETILESIDADAAEVGWANALNGDAHTRRTAAFLVHASLHRTDRLGEVARSLRARFPKKSTPSAAILERLE